MTCAKLLVFLYVLRVSKSDWASEWMVPVHEQFEDSPSKLRRNDAGDNMKLYEEEQKTVPFILAATESPTYYYQNEKIHSISGLKMKLEMTLDNAKSLLEKLKIQIQETATKENLLKEIITQGRDGASTVSVLNFGQAPRHYIIREGVWYECYGKMKIPSSTFFSTNTLPYCTAEEITTNPDTCVFNSLIKYETIPTRTMVQYVEDEYLCLKLTFNTTLEQYMSVPKRLINETCTQGEVRKLTDYVQECGIRTLSEYTYYPNRGTYSTSKIPLEYCTEDNNTCKLIVAWHVSNTTIENFEFFKINEGFTKYFMKGVDHMNS